MMNGIEKITQRIQSDAQAEINAVLTQAREEAAQITARYEAQAQVETTELRAKNERSAAEREERLVSAAQMEARKTALATKQELDDIEAAAAKKMEAAVEFAMNSPEPDPAHVLDDVFYEG